MRSPVLLGAGAGVVIALLALAVAVVLLASSPLGSSVPPGVPTATIPGASPTSGGAPPTFGEPSSPRGPHPPSSSYGSTAAGTPVPTASVGTAIGDLAPTLRLDRLGGGTLDLASLRGRPVWINFMATWCPPCRSELPLMQGYQAELGDRLTIVLVDVREDRATIASFVASLGLTLPVALDGGGRAQQTWGAYALPVHYWIDAHGIVRAVAFGALGPPQFQADVRTVVPDAVLTP